VIAAPKTPLNQEPKRIQGQTRLPKPTGESQVESPELGKPETGRKHGDAPSDSGPIKLPQTCVQGALSEGSNPPLDPNQVAVVLGTLRRTNEPSA
jgi:hypothetical protein